ncbi:MAG: S46 family peptidase [Acidobacteriota bacterium]
MKFRIALLILILFSIITVPVISEEGMLPLSELYKIDLKARGLKINSQELYNPDGVSLVNGIINLSGCTASFVSKEGLILTNYHCAFRAVQGVTTKDRDFMKEGFSATDRKQELRAKGYTVRIIESYEDVSKRVLKVVKKGMSYEKRAKAVKKQIKKIILKVEKKNPGKRADIAEMFIGKTYVLFIYKYIKDVRLVYAPPRSVGEYGGEEDNWMWPRHTGDFAFLRAYVSPEGNSAEYSSENVPYKPSKYLEINPMGVNAEDFVFILGYPGRTYRHRTSDFISYEENLRMPYTVKLYGHVISVLEKLSLADRESAIKLSPLIKGLWNTKKNYTGKLKGLKSLQIAGTRKELENKLQNFIDSKPDLKKKYGNVLKELNSFYQEKETHFNYEFFLRYLRRSSRLLQHAFIIYESSIERLKKDPDRERAYMDRNFKRTKLRIFMGLRNYHETADKVLLKNFLKKLETIKDNKGDKIRTIFSDPGDKKITIDDFIDKIYKKTNLYKKDFIEDLFKKSRQELEKSSDPFIKIAKQLYPYFMEQKKIGDERKGKLDSLLAQLIEAKKIFLGKDFIPDANGTFRLSYGFVRGYSPADGTYSKPFTTISGIVEKNQNKDPFNAPSKLIDLYNKKQYGNYKHSELGKVPVAMLYNLDTTGGNSGSPVLDANGKLIGLNFDRVYEATINDYAWDEKYSRSIGVDIRFILWFVEHYGEANHLIKEMMNK